MLLAGIQLSFTQPMRISDTVVVDGEFGSIEEITLTYVVVRTWDERRLVVPMTRFLDKSFENLTKGSPELLGAVTLHADYAAPVELLRESLEAFVRENPKWDGRECHLQVTDANARTVVLRALVSAADASRCFSLRCEVREHLVRTLRSLEGGRYLPRTRIDLPQAK
jgi:small-conductance mechanosensitive channel